MISVQQLCTKFLAYSKINDAPRTTEIYTDYLTRFLEYIGDKAYLPACDLKPFYINEYISAHPEWSDTYKNSFVNGISRPFGWGVDSGYIDKNPIKKAFKPPVEGRKTYAKLDDVNMLLEHIAPDDSFHDFVTFQWHSFTRPQEVRHIEARHVNLASKLIVFPKKESKGKRRPRNILILKDAYPIIEKLIVQYPEGKLFRNSHGDPWTKAAICQRFSRLSERIGKKITGYDLRHGIITASLESGISVYDIAAASGHVNASMIDKTYSHVHQNKSRLINVFGG